MKASKKICRNGNGKKCELLSSYFAFDCCCLVWIAWMRVKKKNETREKGLCDDGQKEIQLKLNSYKWKIHFDFDHSSICCVSKKKKIILKRKKVQNVFTICQWTEKNVVIKIKQTKWFQWFEMVLHSYSNRFSIFQSICVCVFCWCD